MVRVLLGVVFIRPTESHPKAGAGGLGTLPPLAPHLGLAGRVGVHPGPHLQVQDAWLQEVCGEIFQN